MLGIANQTSKSGNFSFNLMSFENDPNIGILLICLSFKSLDSSKKASNFLEGSNKIACNNSLPDAPAP